MISALALLSVHVLTQQLIDPSLISPILALEPGQDNKRLPRRDTQIGLLGPPVTIAELPGSALSPSIMTHARGI
ncbi:MULTISPECIES: hypothetical protein [unclassified Pseudomonas]|uniref:hypothetical protein n=1 Tax=unclassified Pseudomonas TaxID=196821 RepID=UPI00382BFBCD